MVAMVTNLEPLFLVTELRGTPEKAFNDNITATKHHNSVI
jgi:hypothetical protein